MEQMSIATKKIHESKDHGHLESDPLDAMLKETPSASTKTSSIRELSKQFEMETYELPIIFNSKRI